MWKKIMSRFLLVGGIFFVLNAMGYVDTFVRPIMWPGEKWEYLVERPAMVLHVDPVLFEEILNTGGMHGWKLMEVTDEAHAYTFYFARPLLPHKMASAVARMRRIKELREDKEAAERAHIQSTKDKLSQGIPLSQGTSAGNPQPLTRPKSPQ